MVEEIKRINLPEHPHFKVHHEPQEKKHPKKKGFRWRFLWLPIVILLIIIIFVGGVIYLTARPLIFQGQKTYALGQETYQAVKNQDLVLAGSKLKETEQALLASGKTYQKLVWLKVIPFVSRYYQDGQAALKAAENGVQAGIILIDAVTPYADVLGFKGQGSFMGGTAEDRMVKIVQTLDKVTPKLDEVTQKLTVVEKELEKIDPRHYPEEIKGKKVREKITSLKAMITEASSGVAEAKPILTVLPKILGYPDNKQYLVLFQNDGELRGTGGFLTAYAVLKIESGKMKPEKSDDIYSLDKKYKSRLKPPEPIKKYLFSTEFGTGLVPYYYLRDMNFSPDFKISMETFKQYYDKIPGETKVDGIIAVDTDVLAQLVAILGPINVPGYGKFTVEPDKRCHGIPNIICELEYLVDEPLPTESGSRKQTILGPMMQEIMLKAMVSPKQLWPTLFSASLKFLKEKHLLLYFTDNQLEQAVEAFNAAGRIKEYDGDYLHINDSNFGGAKANLFTKHQVEQEYEISETGRATKTLTITYENPEPMDNCNLERKAGLCLNSILRNYLRVYVPKGSKLIESLGSEVKMETGEELGKTFFEGFLTVRGGGGRAKVVLKYELPFEAKKSEDFPLLIQKQPGTVGHQYKVFFGDQVEEFDLRTDRELKFKY